MIRFTKMEGTGNDYVYLDGSAHPSATADPSRLAVRMSDRRLGVGSDGIVLMLPPDPGVDAHIRMRMFNADGSEAEMCGNGIRCLGKYAREHGLCSAHPLRVQTGAGVLELQYTLDARGKVERVTVDMGEPGLDPLSIPVTLPAPAMARVVDVPLADLVPEMPSGGTGGPDGRVTCVSMGNPHAVLYCPLVREVPVEAIGAFLEHQPIFPRRINVHFVQVDGPGEVTMRSWERGSGETLACGTGASAVCVAGVLTGRTQRRLLVHLPGGDLELHWESRGNHVFMTGPAREVFCGEWPEETDGCRGAGV